MNAKGCLLEKAHLKEACPVDTWSFYFFSLYLVVYLGNRQEFIMGHLIRVNFSLASFSFLITILRVQFLFSVKRDIQENDEEAVQVKEQSILELGSLLAKTGQAAGKSYKRMNVPMMLLFETPEGVSLRTLDCT